jgi:surface protein
MSKNCSRSYEKENIMAWTKTANIKGEQGWAGTRSTSVFFNSSSNELDGDLKIDSDGALYVYEVPKTQFATFDASTGTLRFWNRETVPSVGDKDPEGHNVDNVFTELNYQDNNQSVFNSIAENLKTAIVVDRVSFTNTTYMFHNCQSLATLDLSNSDTSKVTDMSSMFRYCSSLTTLDVSNFDTSKVTDMRYMFGDCQSLTTLDLSNFDSSNVTDMRGMFYGCQSLTTLDLSNFDTSNVTNMNGMFNRCSSLATLDLSNFNTSNVTDTSWMFNSCSNLTNLDCSHWNVDKVTSYDRFNYNAPKVIPPVWKN